MSIRKITLCTYTAIGIMLLADINYSQAALSSKEYSTPPAPAAPRAAAIAAPVESRLANGLRVVTAQRKGLPLVTSQLLVLTGAEADPKGMAGLAEMTAGLLTKGTKAGDNTPAMGATQIAQAAEALGGSLSPAAGWHRSSIAITVTTPKLDAALRLLAACATRPAFAADELGRLRAQAEDGLSVALADPGRLAGFAAARAVFGEHAYGNMASGNPASLKRLTVAQVQQQHQQSFQPANAVLIFTGDIAPEQSAALAQTHFGAWKAGATTASAAKTAAVSPTKTPPIIIDMPDAGQAGVSVSWLSVATGAPDYYQGLVSNAVLGNGYSSRLNQEIRIKRGLSYGAGSRFEPRRTSGIQKAVAQTKNESAVEVLQLMETELAKLASASPSEEELSARKATLIGSFSRNLETTEGLAGEVAAQMAGGAPAAAITEQIGKISAVTAAQASAFAKARAAPEQQRIVIAGDARKFGEALRKLKPTAQTVPFKSIDMDAADLRTKP
jgi:zinc protease